MAQVYKDIIRLTVDLKTGVKEVIAPIKQADNLSRVLRCQLVNNGKPVSLKGSQLMLYVIKADFKQCVINGVINEGKAGIVDFELTEQSLILAKEIQCEIVKIDEGDVLLSFPIFKIGIDGVLYDNGLVESTNEFSALTALISNVASWENKFVGECERIEEKFDGKIGEVNAQLSYIDSKKLDKNGIVTMANMAQDVKEAMTGGGVAVVGRNSVLNENIVDRQIKHQKFAQSFLHSDIRVAPDTDNSTLNTLLPTGYMFVMAGSYGMPVDISNQTCLLENITCEDRFVYQKIHAYVNPNKYYIRYFDYSTGSYGEWSCLNIDDILLASEKIQIDNLDGAEVKQNLLNKETFVVGGLTQQGEVNPDVVNNYCSDYIPIKPKTPYYRRIANLVVVAFYDKDKNFINRPTIQAGAIIETPSDAFFMRYTDTQDAMNDEVISEIPITEYVEYQPDLIYKLTKCAALLEDKSVSRNKLADNFLSGNKFLDSSFDLNTFTKDGVFVCTGVINKPDEIKGTSFLINRCFNNDGGGARWIIQEMIDFFDMSVRFCRKLDLYNQENSTNWFNISVSDSPSNSNNYKSKFKGKKLVTFGDSITEGVGATNSSKNYPSILTSKYGLIVENKGISGASWANYGDGEDWRSILTQISDTDFSDVDYVTIFCGTNDFGRGARPIGNNDDMIESTMKGAINLAIQRIIQAKPSIRIAIITPMWRQRFSSGDNKDSDFNTLNGVYLQEYVDAVKEMADYNHIPCLDFYHNCMINKYNYQTFLSDGLHPNDLGYELVADMIHAFLERTY